MLFYPIVIFVVLVDQVSKYLIRSYVEVGETFTLWGIPMTHYENSGMARSMFQGYGRFFGVIAVLFVIGVLYYRGKGDIKGPILSSGFGFLVGGAIGNGIDRLLYGQVTDFLMSYSSNGVLNLADHAIEIGVLLLVIYGVTRLFRRNPSNVKAAKDETP